MKENETIKVLEEALRVADETISRQRAEIERLTSIHDELCCEISDIAHINLEEYEKIRAEAVKEFAERLKVELVVSQFECDGFLYDVYDVDETCDKIDQIAKEMVGEQRDEGK